MELRADGLAPAQMSSGHLVTGTSRFGLVRDAEAKEAAQRTSAAVSRDGSTLFAGNGDSVIRIDAEILRAGGVARLEGE